ncbi:MAG: transporter permease [Subtercola sp.]|nr:transporter permease [Subtercola sp.]
MTSLAPRPLWAGRALALVGVLLVAINLRTAVAALSPIFSDISVDIPLGSLGIGVLGTLPPLCFAVFGLLTPVFQRHLRLESLLLIALGAVVLGDVGRGLSGSYWMLAVSSVVTFAGMGTGNVLLPPLVKKYFPDRIGLVTSLYATVMALFSLFPPLVAVPLSDATNWRISVSVWGVFGLIAVLPWIRLLVRDRQQTPPAAVSTVEGVIAGPDAQLMGRAWHSSLAWALGIMFGITSLNVYAIFAWLPELLVDSAGLDPALAGSLLALYSGIGIPMALVIPILAARLTNISVLVWVGGACYGLGDLGLLLVPSTATWLWIALIGTGPLLFPLSLVLINLRTRTQAGSVALSGFMQGVGYIIGAVGPLAVGILHQLTGEWTLPLIFLLATVPVIVIAGLVVARPRMLEDGWHPTGRTLDR